MLIRALTLALSCLTSGSAAAEPVTRKVTVIVERRDHALLRALTTATEGRAALSVHELRPGAAIDPIEKGKLVAALETRDLIVAVGDAATAFVTRELEDTPVYFVGASLVRGEDLAAPRVSGLFSYSVNSLLDAVQTMLPGTLGLAYTPGYEPVASWIRKGATERRMTLAVKRIESLKELAPSVRELLEVSRSIWVVGDPTLVRDAGFDFLRERTLSRSIPLVANGAAEVRQGALLAFEADDLGPRAAAMLVSILDGKLAVSERLQPAPREGTLLLNAALAEKWKLAAPPGRPWRPLR